jgi:hypothetical protein
MMAGNLLESMMMHVLLPQKFALTIQSSKAVDSGAATYEFEEGRCLLLTKHGHSAAGIARYLGNQNCSVLCHLSDCMVARVVRPKKTLHCFATNFIKQVIRVIESGLEDSQYQNSPWWTSLDHRQLPVLRLGSSRARRVSTGYKRSLNETALDVHQSMGNLVVVEGALKSRKRSGLAVAPAVHPRTANRFLQDNIMQYLMLSRKTLFKTKHCSVSLDGVRCSGHEVTLYALWCHDLGIGAWAPPQVPNPLCDQIWVPNPFCDKI